jgi:hypothetical protein
MKDNTNKTENFVNIYTTAEHLLINWYQKVFGFEFITAYYNAATRRDLAYYHAQTPNNMPWKMPTFPGILLHPNYSIDDCQISNTESYLGFDWKEYNGIKREPLYKLNMKMTGTNAFKQHLSRIGLNYTDESYEIDELLIIIVHKSRLRLVDPRGNIITIHDIDNSYKKNIITGKRFR